MIAAANITKKYLLSRKHTNMISKLLNAKFIMPAEWQPHEGCFLIYPHNTGVFRSQETKCDFARAEVRNIARAICQRGEENVFLMCNTKEEASELESILEKEDDGNYQGACKVVVDVCPSDDSWCRDTGPTFVYVKDSTELVGLDWDFNAYGGPDEGCYWPCELDRKVAQNMVDFLSRGYATSSMPIIHHPVKEIVLEGGSFHTDGEGTILTTEECLLNPNRNPQLSKDKIESILMEYLGAQKVIWLPHGVAYDDDTNGHVDNIATFARPGEVVLSWTDDESDVNYERFKAAESVLNKEVDAKGRSFKIHKLYIPKPMVSPSKIREP
jgi:agmatine deiminase